MSEASDEEFFVGDLSIPANTSASYSELLPH